MPGGAPLSFVSICVAFDCCLLDGVTRGGRPPSHSYVTENADSNLNCLHLLTPLSPVQRHHSVQIRVLRDSSRDIG